MKKEFELNLNAGDYAISHCDSDKTYNGLEVHKMLCDAYIAGNNDTLEDDDERIKNSLINLIKMSSEVGGLALHKWEADEMLAWLEKHSSSQTKENNPLKQSGQKASYTTIVKTGNGGINALVTRELPTEMKTAEESLGIDSDTYNKIVDECIFGEQNPEENRGNIGGISPNWSEEDDKNLRRAIRATKVVYPVAADWLKSLKDRVGCEANCTTTKEWSEDDKRKIDRIYSILRQAADTHAFSTSCRLIGDKECMELQDWLKSLRPRITWKPSDEQIAQLQIVIDTYGNEGVYDPILTELLFQLKKLKEKV